MVSRDKELRSRGSNNPTRSRRMSVDQSDMGRAGGGTVRSTDSRGRWGEEGWLSSTSLPFALDEGLGSQWSGSGYGSHSACESS